MSQQILIIEDDKDIQEVLSVYLEMKGYHVTGAPDLIVSEMSVLPDVILMDVSLSGKSGKDICKALKSTDRTAHIPVIMMSATPSARKGCLDAGAQEFIAKPFQLTQIASAIKKFSSNPAVDKNTDA